MHLYRTDRGALLHHQKGFARLWGDWDVIINRDNLFEYLVAQANANELITEEEVNEQMKNLRAPIGEQEVWAAGVTYLRSRDARMEESKESGTADVYQKVYEADRPELFFKALPHRVAATGEDVYIRSDSSWNVPEPELTLFINSSGSIQGYTIGNDMSSRSIEGENPLYLPQAKIYERSCALGPCLYVPEKPLPLETRISISISRLGTIVFNNSIQLNRMKRTLPELAGWLTRGCRFPHGCFLMTGTGVVPENDFTLSKGDIVEIEIQGIGKLANTVAIL